MMLGPLSCVLLSFSQACGPERQSISILLFQIRFLSFWLTNRNGPILLTLTLEAGADLRVRVLGRNGTEKQVAVSIVTAAAVSVRARARAAGPRSAIRRSGSAAPPLA